LDPIVVGFKSLLVGNTNLKLPEALLASIRPLNKSAETMGFNSLHQAFVLIEEQLKWIVEKQQILPSNKILLVQAYENLIKLLPASQKQAASLEMIISDSSTNSLILALVKSSTVDSWMIQALLEVGINSPGRLLSTSSQEIQAVTGLPEDKCKEILWKCRYALSETK
jgi:hypothetical protein